MAIIIKVCIKHGDKMSNLDRPNTAVLTAPFQNIVGAVILSSFIDILEPLFNELFVITDKNINKNIRGDI